MRLSVFWWVPLLGALLWGIAFFTDQSLKCAIRTNMLSVGVVKGYWTEEASANGMADSRSDTVQCASVSYFLIHSAIVQQNYLRALDILDRLGEGTEDDNHRLKLLPQYLLSLAAARNAADLGRLEQSIDSYRSAIALMNRTAPGTQRILTSQIMPSYEKTVADWMTTSGSNRSSERIFRVATLYWYSDQLPLALDTILSSSIDFLQDTNGERLQSLHALITGDLAMKSKDSSGAVTAYALVSHNQRDLYLRSLLRRSQLTNNTTLDILQILSEWEPSITFKPSSVFASYEITGVEIFESEVIQDGARVCLALFGRGNQPFSAKYMWQNANQWVVEICRPNLLMDPGFEWNTNWYMNLYGDMGNPPERRQVVNLGRSDYVICLNNTGVGAKRFSGIVLDGGSVIAGEQFLLIGRSDGGSVGVMGNWQTFSNAASYFYPSGLVDSATEWPWIGGILQVPILYPQSGDTLLPWGMQVYVVNYDTSDVGCVSDLVLLNLDATSSYP